MKKAVVLVAICVLLAGCATASINLYDNNVSYTPTDAKTIKVYKEMPKNVELIKIGEITVDNKASWRQVESSLKKEAAKLGADAVYIVDTQTAQQGGTFTNAFTGQVQGYNYKTMMVTGVAVKYKDK